VLSQVAAILHCPGDALEVDDCCRVANVAVIHGCVFHGFCISFIDYRVAGALHRLAKKLIEASSKKQSTRPGQLTVHADRGSSMTSKPVALTLSDLGVPKTHSRLHLSNDNPYSEAQFKTLKYGPEFPDRFGGAEDARAFCARFFDWYNNKHAKTGWPRTASIASQNQHIGFGP
jgi:transposase InsO family protein